MKISESITNNLLIEVDSLIARQRNIRQCLKNTHNIKLMERLIYENITIFERVNEIYRISEFLIKKNNERISFKTLLIESAKRGLNEIRKESYLFYP